MTELYKKFVLALLIPIALVMGGGIWGGTAQHTHRSADQGGVISWIPTGFVGCYAGSTPPTNTLEAYGQAVSRITYAGLFSHLGTTHGAGDGVTTFNLPDLRGRVMIGMDNMGGSAANRITVASTGGANSTTLGGSGGAEMHTLTIAQMPAHVHREQYANGGTGATVMIGGDNNPSSAVTGEVDTQSTGGGAAHNNTQPWIALKCVIGT